MSFSLQRLLVIHKSQSDSISPQVTRTLLSILVDLNNASVRIVSILLLISNSSKLLSKLIGIVPTALTTIGITVNVIFHSFLSSLARSWYLSLFRFILLSLCGSQERQNPLDRKFSFFFLFFFWPGWDDVSQNPEEFYRSHSLERVLVCAYTIWEYGQISILLWSSDKTGGRTTQTTGDR